MLRILTFGAISIFTAIPARSQQWNFNQSDKSIDSLPQRSFLQVRYQVGRLANTNTDAIKYIESNPYQSIDFRYGIFGNGKKMWHQLHHHPTYGVGISKVLFQPTENILGNPWTAYAFYNQPFLRLKTSSLGYDFSFGLAGNWKPYDQQTNPEQKAIGSHVTGQLGFAVQYDFKLSNRLDGIIGLSLTHFSNGRIRSPNRGLNLYGLNASVRYRLGASGNSAEQKMAGSFLRVANIHHEIATFHPYNEFYVVGSLGAVTTFQDINNRSLSYMAGSLSIDIAHHFSYTQKLGIGLDWSYDESLKVVYQNDYPAGSVPTHLLYWPGMHLSYEYMVHRWTFITQAGVNLKVTGDKGLGYGRLGLRYDLTKHIFLRVGLRVYKFVASDFLEWGVGYSWAKRK